MNKEKNVAIRVIGLLLAFTIAAVAIASVYGQVFGARASAEETTTTSEPEETTTTAAGTTTTTTTVCDTTTSTTAADTTTSTTAAGTTTTTKKDSGNTESHRNLILIGDSRTVGMYYTLHPKEKAKLSEHSDHPEYIESLTVSKTETTSEGRKVIWEAENGSGYKWMTKTGVPKVEKSITSKSDVFILVGVNDIKDSDLKQSYIDYLNKKGAAWAAKGARVFFVSILPEGNKNGTVEYPRIRKSLKEPNSVIRSWNSTIKSGLSKNVTFLDAASLIGPTYTTFDQIHYSGTTYKLIWRLLKDKSDGKMEQSAADYTGTYVNLKGTYYVENGKVNTTWNKLKKVDGIYRFYDSGAVRSSANGLQKPDSTWRVYNYGSWASKVSGLFKNKNGWYYCKDGVVDFDYNSVASNYNGTYYVKNGKVNFNVNGLAKCGKNWYLFKKGRVETSKTGLYKNDHGWWYVKNGKIDFNYNGLAKNKYGTWVVKNGKVNFNYNGSYKYKGKTYKIKNGKVV